MKPHWVLKSKSISTFDVKTNSTRRILKRVFWAFVRIYALVVVAVYLLQSRLLYLRSENSLATVQQQAADARLSLWPNKASYQALVRVPSGSAQGTVIMFHGNAGTADDRAYFATQFEHCGFRTLLVEYPGYGARTLDSVALRQAPLAAEGGQIILTANAQFASPIFVVGESLGAAVAAQAIQWAEKAQPGVVSGALLITPWDELASAANRRFWFLPVRLILADQYNSVLALKDFYAPLLVVRATRDELIPAGSTEALFNSFSGPKKMFNVPGGHNSWSENISDSGWLDLCNTLQELR